MVFGEGFLGFVLLGLWIFCIIDVITTDEALVRNLQKTLWLLIVILLADLGAVLWLIAGRPWPQSTGRAAPAGPRSAYPEYERPGRFAATNPHDDAAILSQVRDRAEQQRRRYAEQQAELRRQEEEAERLRREKGTGEERDE